MSAPVQIVFGLAAVFAVCLAVVAVRAYRDAQLRRWKRRWLRGELRPYRRWDL